VFWVFWWGFWVLVGLLLWVFCVVWVGGGGGVGVWVGVFFLGCVWFWCCLFRGGGWLMWFLGGGEAGTVGCVVVGVGL